MRSRPRLLAIPSLIIACSVVLIGCGGAGSTASSGDATAGTSSRGAGPAASPSPGAPAATEVNAPAGDIPDDQHFIPYDWPAGGFTLTVPEGWARTESNGVVTFTDKLNNIRIETAQLAQAPTVDSVRNDELPAVASSTTNYAAGDTTSVSRTAGNAVLATYTGLSATDPVTNTAFTDDFERYAFWNNGVEVILTLSGPQGSDNVDPWRTVTDSLQWLP